MTKEKAFAWGGVALLILFIAFRPASAAQVFKAIGGGIVDIATGFGDFVTNLVSDTPGNLTQPYQATPCPTPPDLTRPKHKKGFSSPTLPCQSSPTPGHRAYGTFGPEQLYKLQPARSAPKPKPKKVKKRVTGYGVMGPVKSILADQGDLLQFTEPDTPRRTGSGPVCLIRPGFAGICAV